ncbi:MAG: EamA family transporter [Propioniciclava sp.]|uniref:DMT family transporter n=1 Tax=Propioniciclava sp. TaxID=2038686 RepID=UPI0039E34879
MARQRQADLLLIVTTILAAFGWVFSREAISGMPTYAFLGIRFTCAALIMLPFCRGAGLRREHWRPMLISGALFALNLCLWVFSLSVSPTLSEGAFIMSLSMVFVPLTAWAMMRTRPSRAYWECLPVAIVGLALLSLQIPIHTHPSQGWWLLTAAGQSIWFVYSSNRAREVPLLPLSAVQMGMTGIAGVTISLTTETWTQPMTLPVFGWLAASILITTCLRFAVQLRGQKYAAVANAAIIMMLEPVFTALAATLWYGEQLPPQKIAGGVLIIVAQVWFRWRVVREQRRRPFLE